MFSSDAGISSPIVCPTVLLSSTLMAVVFFFVPRSIADPDIWWHLRNAQILSSTHRFIGTDLYSYTAFGAPWINHEWLGELPFYFGWLHGREHGLYLITVLAVELLIMGIFLLAYRRSRNLKSSLLGALIAAALSTVSFGPRTVLFGWILLVVELLLLDFSRDWPFLLWMFPTLFLVWVNTHGTWMIGMVLFALYVMAESPRISGGHLHSNGLAKGWLRQLLCSFALSFAALFVNPYGWRLVAYPINLAVRQKLNIANVEEWRSLDLLSLRGGTLLLCLALLALSQLYRPRTWRPHEVVYLLIGTYAALTHSRFLVLFSILVIPLFARSISLSRGDDSPVKTPSSLTGAALLFLLCCLVVGRLKDPPELGSKGEAAYPSSSLAFLHGQQIHGRILNEYLWGGYIIWNARSIPVFIDSRVDIFEYNGTFKDYLDIIRIKNTVSLLNKYNIEYVFFEKDTPLVYLLEHTGRWKADFDDGNVVLLERIAHEEGDL
ncbi:hypothetical protein GRAN_4629 [Granulicella sibirica]|uniref:Uncharacterized protein n=2 Tax=Granulicella sibirica TaxID=2479048 RepID=A0A4Q0STL9_9BACT|nr:hypothetical protein GRAN_4629 [Granulicella sibirica]